MCNVLWAGELARHASCFFLAEQNGVHFLAGGEGDVLAEVFGWEGLGPAGGGDDADDVGAGGEVGEGEVAGGVGGGLGIGVLESAAVGEVDVDGPAGEAEFAGVLDAVGVGVVEDFAGDGGGGGGSGRSRS